VAFIVAILNIGQQITDDQKFRAGYRRGQVSAHWGGQAAPMARRQRPHHTPGVFDFKRYSSVRQTLQAAQIRRRLLPVPTARATIRAAKEEPMREQLDQLLHRYENGGITRRELLGTLAALTIVAAPAAAAAEPAIGTVKQINHVTIFVQDVQKSVDFYQGLFGMPILTRQDPGINIKAGPSFFGVYPARGQATGLNHICFGLDNFDADSVLEKLKSRGLNGAIRLRGDTKELYFSDPDGIRVQLQDVSYRGGVGPLGDRDPK
jgi:catechol 2,3-dioxygenase-like lactoylglutathione lyase family enzyme